YGTIEEDVQRRDFTINALYYDLNNEQIIDFLGAMADFRKQQMRNIIPLPQIFKEDPVRMIRCAKYAAKTGFKIPRKIALQLRRDCKLLYNCSQSRLAEELSKILCSEQCPQIMKKLLEFNILEILSPCLNPKDFPGTYEVDFSENMLAWQKRLQLHNQVQDEAIRDAARKRRRHKKNKDSPEEQPPSNLLDKNPLGVGLSYLFAAYFNYSGQWPRLLGLNGEERSFEMFIHMKECLNDLNIPNVEISTACECLAEREGLPFLPRLILKKYGRLGEPKRKHAGRRGGRKNRKPKPRIQHRPGSGD
ncbi:MAG: hypothetical protein AAF975_05710, partial [Spirochaetota bacterium]